MALESWHSRENAVAFARTTEPKRWTQTLNETRLVAQIKGLSGLRNFVRLFDCDQISELNPLHRPEINKKQKY